MVQGFFPLLFHCVGSSLHQSKSIKNLFALTGLTSHLMQVPASMQRSLALEIHERNQIFHWLWLNLGSASICKKFLLFPPGTWFLIVATALVFIVPVRFLGRLIIIIIKFLNPIFHFIFRLTAKSQFGSFASHQDSQIQLPVVHSEVKERRGRNCSAAEMLSDESSRAQVLFGMQLLDLGWN